MPVYGRRRAQKAPKETRVATSPPAGAVASPPRKTKRVATVWVKLDIPIKRKERHREAAKNARITKATSKIKARAYPTAVKLAYTCKPRGTGLGSAESISPVTVGDLRKCGKCGRLVVDPHHEETVHKCRVCGRIEASVLAHLRVVHEFIECRNCGELIARASNHLVEVRIPIQPKARPPKMRSRA